MKTGFIGLGQMGRGMAARLVDKGFDVVAWNRSAAPAEALREHGARIASAPAQTLDADVIVTMLADDAAVEAVWLESGLVSKMPAGAVHLNMSSVSLRLATKLRDAHAAGAYVAAPVFGRPASAASGELDIVAGGKREAIARCGPLFDALGRRWFDVGDDPTHANVVKIARNFVLASIIESLGEAFALVEKSGVEPARFHDIITSTAMSCPSYRNYGRLIIDKPAEATFTVKLGLKDVELALQVAGDTGVPLPLGELMREQHLGAIARGYGEREWASVGNYIAEKAGL
ncbi:MAG TPA: NAD(P)-dependent oxidoreductase [Burkholderiales bacterium]|nr:NAD(P)-dependent oxidoreductase [Burkholderiales bacterium]